MDIYDSPILFAFLSQSARGSDLARPVGLRNVLCTRVSSASLSQVFVRTSCRQLAIYLRTTITMCYAKLFLDVMLLCFVLQQLKIHPYLAGLQIQTVLFLIRPCEWYYCWVLILWHKVVGWWSESFIDTWRHQLLQTAAGEAAGSWDSQGDGLTIDVCLHVMHVCAFGPGSPLSQLSRGGEGGCRLGVIHSTQSRSFLQNAHVLHFTAHTPWGTRTGTRHTPRRPTAPSIKTTQHMRGLSVAKWNSILVFVWRKKALEAI